MKLIPDLSSLLPWGMTLFPQIVRGSASCSSEIIRYWLFNCSLVVCGGVLWFNIILYLCLVSYLSLILFLVWIIWEQIFYPTSYFSNSLTFATVPVKTGRKVAVTKFHLGLMDCDLLVLGKVNISNSNVRVTNSGDMLWPMLWLG